MAKAKKQPLPKAKQSSKAVVPPTSTPDLLADLPRGVAKKVLHVGCGQKYKKDLPALFQSDDWQEIRLDISSGAQPDIIADIMDMKPVGDNSMDALFSSHNIEHVYIHQVQTVLKEFHRVIRPGGLAVITCPDLQSVAFHIAQGNLEGKLYDSPSGIITPLEIFYGHTDSLKRGQHYMAHKCGFTAETLAKRMLAVGFRNIVIERDTNFNLWARGNKFAAHDPRMASDKATVKGDYPKMVVDRPDVGPRNITDELDLPPKRWKPLGLKKN
jgi:SAM-dependent methyltransferase